MLSVWQVRAAATKGEGRWKAVKKRTQPLLKSPVCPHPENSLWALQLQKGVLEEQEVEGRGVKMIRKVRICLRHD